MKDKTIGWFFPHLLIYKKAPPCIGRGFLWLLEAADDTERGEQGRESGDNHLDDCLDDVLLHRLKVRDPPRPSLFREGVRL